ncbi:hypothetical protein PFICI_06017 [Pestalotiopsis fici W106-1]|uniref:Fungal lipase-type domain-containing protein n=1 Tax=Pestalotiopsis fici (strain W106-1 / CGMCC3.15140) TaxID=1229662 RepID=W3X4M6_PESFW|nr:uncharacterized protein PFICI_06017 [Pestalotiopsis fici W106-1]ETS81015.1 hypothetical protein PFICI_06017 [Pestalotiopsis fici W106-1]
MRLLNFCFPLLASVSIASPVLETNLALAAASRHLTTPAVADQSDLDNFKLYAKYAGASYCNIGNLGAPTFCKGNLCLDNTTTLARFTGATTDIAAYLSVNSYRKELVVGVRGSYNIRNWLADLRFLQASCPYGAMCRVHRGFWQAFQDITDDSFYEALRESIHNYPDYNVTVTGHSLGGAVALLLGSYIREEFESVNVDIYTYGAPRVGNVVFMNYLRNQPGKEYRITHFDDQVPRLPPASYLGYAHSTPEYWLRDGPANRLIYTPEEVIECTGYVNMDCSGSGYWPGVISHLYYFVKMTECGDGHSHGHMDLGDLPRFAETTWNKTGYDKDLLERLEMFAQMDQQYAEVVAEVSNPTS